MNYLASWVVLDVYSLILLGVCMYGSLRHGAFASDQRLHFSMLLFLVVILTFADIAQRSGMDDSNWIVQSGRAICFGFDGWIPSLWLGYAVSKMGRSVKDREKLPIRLWSIGALSYSVLNMVISIASIWTGWVFTIDASGAYQAGPLFVPHALGVLFSIIAIEIIIILHRKDMVPGSFAWVVVLPSLTLIGGFLQIMLGGLPLEITGTAVSLQLLYIFQVNRNVNIDFLTRVGNRRMLEEAFDTKIHTAESGHSFSALIIDLDSFKQMNDTYGHVAGDRALVSFAHVLKSTFRARDYITRFGGDEFCVICDITDQKALDDVVARLRANLEAFNMSETLPFPIGMSIGYGIYKPQDGEDKEEFRARIDSYLYREKYAKTRG